MTTHTAGPWTASPDGLIHAGKNRLHIAQAATIGMGHAAAANARLIAAAPDLLAALRLILESEETHGDSVVCDFETLQSVARAAVAKAIGE